MVVSLKEAQEFVTAASTSQLPANGVLQVTVHGQPILLCESEGRYVALSAICPHRGGPLGACPPENGRLFCPMHGWEFEVQTGACVNRPDRPATRYAVRVVGEDIQIQV